MKHKSKLYIVFLMILFIFIGVANKINAQENNNKEIWIKSIGNSQPDDWNKSDLPRFYNKVKLDKKNFLSLINNAPLEFTQEAKTASFIITLPMPDGSFIPFKFVESPIFDKSINPKSDEIEIKTYNAQGLNDPTIKARFGWTINGFHAMIISLQGTIIITPLEQNNTTDYISYRKSDINKSEDLKCLSDNLSKLESPLEVPKFNSDSGSSETLRIYRIAIPTTVEYTTYQRLPNETDNQLKTRVYARVVILINLLNLIYENDLAIRFYLISGMNLIHTEEQDGYSNGYFDNVDLLFEQNEIKLNTIIGSADYDIGHVLAKNSIFYSGGKARHGSTCQYYKAHGFSALPEPDDLPTSLEVLAHEIGHHMGAHHTFNGTQASCGVGGRNADTAVEPGSGSTIMSYSGICGSQNLQNYREDYFHIASLLEIKFTSNNYNCGTPVSLDNTKPFLTTQITNYTIPPQTTFRLKTTATDAENDLLTYNWEQMNLGNPSPPDNDTDGQVRPMFRSFLPSSENFRSFPRTYNERKFQTPFDNIDILPRGNPTQRLGTGLGGKFAEIEVKYEKIGSSTHYYYFIIEEFGDETYNRTNNYNFYFANTQKNSGGTGYQTDVWKASDFPTIVFDPNKYYAFTLYQLDAKPFGSATQFHPDLCYNKSSAGGNNLECDPSENIKTMYFRLKLTGAVSGQYIEPLPTISQQMEFRATVRDNHFGGGLYSWANITVNVDASRQPFAVTQPNTSQTIMGGTQQVISWNTSFPSWSLGNNGNVNILFSTDGGETYPTILSSNTLNDGSESVFIPNISTNAGRIKIESVESIFFDVSDTDFTVVAPTASSTSVRGRVLSSDGRAINRAVVSLINQNGQTQTSVTNAFGYYKFEDVGIGQTYTLNVRKKGVMFTPQVLAITEEISDLELTGIIIDN